eukprot:2030903-Rhodomonas_salina.1
MSELHSPMSELHSPMSELHSPTSEPLIADSWRFKIWDWVWVWVWVWGLKLGSGRGSVTMHDAGPRGCARGRQGGPTPRSSRAGT